MNKAVQAIGWTRVTIWQLRTGHSWRRFSQSLHGGEADQTAGRRANLGGG